MQHCTTQPAVLRHNPALVTIVRSPVKWPKLGVVNHSALPLEVLESAVQVANRQIEEDFVPIWGAGAECVLLPDGSQSAAPEIAAVVALLDDALGLSVPVPGEGHSVPCKTVCAGDGDLSLLFTREALELIIRSAGPLPA